MSAERRARATPVAFAPLLGGCSPRRAAPTVVVPPTVAALPTVPPATLVLVGGTLIDGAGAAPVADAVLVIAGDRITAVGPRAQVAVPAAERVIDVQGATILPGFINAHVHNCLDTSLLVKWAQAGVTTVRDLGRRCGRPSWTCAIACATGLSTRASWRLGRSSPCPAATRSPLTSSPPWLRPRRRTLASRRPGCWTGAPTC